MQTDFYIVSINDGEEELNFAFEPDARKLYQDLIEDPAEHYSKITLIKYNYETKEEIVLDNSDVNTNVVLEDLDQVLSNPVESLPVVEIDPDPVESNYSHYTTLVYTLQSIANDMKYIHWNCCGINFDKVHSITEEYYDVLNDQLDLFAEIALEQSGITLPSPSVMANKLDWPVLSDSNCINTEEAWKLIQNLLETLVDTLQYNYDKFSTDVQSEIDPVVRYWKKELYYKIVRRIGGRTNG